MEISRPCVVSLTWKLQDADGHLIDELADPVEFFFGGDDLLAKVEEALIDQEIGFATALRLEPENSFGEYDASLVFFEDRAIFPDAIEVGMQFDGVPPGAATQGMPNEAVYNVTEVYPGHVVLDGNHPLAGIALRLDLIVRGVRAATDEEAEAGSVGEPVFTVMNTAPRGPAMH